MKTLFLIFIGVMIVCSSIGQQSKFDFPVLVERIEVEKSNDEISYKDTLTEYFVDSIKIVLDGEEKYFRFLLRSDFHTSLKIENDSIIEISIDFDGYKYIKVGNEALLVFNPYLGYKSDIIDVSEQMTEPWTDGDFTFKTVFRFSKRGEVLFTPLCNENEIDFKSILRDDRSW